MTNNTPSKFYDVVSLNQLNEFEINFKERVKQEEYQVPGAAFAIVHGNDLIVASGHGVRDLKTHAPVTRETLFPIGSMSKSMTAVMNATQVEAGIFGWETLVKDISPHFKFANRETTEKLQVKHLIGMRSGIRDPIGPNNGENDKYWEGQSAPYVIRTLANAPFEAMPGEKFHYGNECYASTGYLSPLKQGVDASQLLQEYNNLMHKHIFAPIGMTKTCITPICSSISDNYAASYGLDTSNGQASQMKEVPISISNVSGIAPSGQVVSNVIDLSLYARMLLNKGVTIDGVRILSEESVDKLWNDTIDAPGFPGLTKVTKYGLGWEIQEVNLTNPDRKIQAIAHGGLLPSWVSWLMVVPDINAGLIILTNSWSGFYLIFDAAKEFLKWFYPDHLDESQFIDYRSEYLKYIQRSPKQIQEKVSSYTVKPDEVQPLLGNYQGGWNLEVNQDNQLVLFKTGWVFYLFPSKAGQHNYIIGASNDTSYLNPDHLDDERNKIGFSIDPVTEQVTMTSSMGTVTKLVEPDNSIRPTPLKLWLAL
ncbi:serine hydrolase domain-containing protein [Tolypothrix sp. VBCCA 56010]|uniref:serine hydrolase domain-containing protein n=1 Tax=Tolypothrix sp. VBCCA 56010 TaxID=3137731 RepID=UPI003D7D8F4F